jgi:glucose/arabinose dehydrogenase
VVAHVDQSKKGEEAAVLQSNSVINRVLRRFRTGLVALAALFVAVAASVASATTLPAGFSETTVVTGLSAPTAFAFAPDGRIFVCQQNGQLRIYTSTGSSLGTAGTIVVASNSERGLLGIAFDPDFTSNGYIYLYYPATSGSLNPPPSPKNRISRFTISGNAIVAGSETILLDLIPSDAGNHNGGQLRIGADGKLYASAGDGGATSSNSQSLTTLAGKILRINRNGSIPSDNPFFNSGDPNVRKEIWCYGLRNPWRFTFQPGTEALYIADVGQNTWEEVNVGLPGANYGWPQAEGLSTNPAFTNPIFTYNHNGTGASISGGAFYNGTTYPTEYDGAYFYGDYVDNFIRRLTIDENNVVVHDEPFATDAPSPVSIEYYDNAIWYACYGSGGAGTIRKAVYTGGANRSPVAMASATPIAGLAPLNVAFSSAGTSDPDNDSLSYFWDFGDGTNSTSANPTHAYTGPSRTVMATLTVTDNGSPNLSDTSAPVRIVIGDRAPTATITSPSNGAFYNAGQTINYSGTGTDPEDGTRPASAFTWRVVFHHAEHTHPFLGPITGVTSGSFVIPNTGETATDVFYEVILTVTDSQGVPDTKSVVINPNVSSLTFQTNPAGLMVTVDGQPVQTPATIDSVVGMLRTIGVSLPQTSGQTTYDTFGGWSDGGVREHTITTPGSATTYTATLIAGGAGPRTGLAGDWNGDTTTTIGLYLRDTGTFALRNANSPGAADLFFGFGPANPAWLPIAGDWDSNVTRTPGLYDPTTGAFFLRNTSSPGGADIVFTYGGANAGLKPIVGDWDGDGDETIGLYDPATGAFFLRNSNSAGPADLVFTFGPAGGTGVPIAGDWDGNNVDTIGIYVPSTGSFFLRNSNSSGAANLTFSFGAANAGLAPLAGNWDGAGGVSIGLYDAANGVFFLKNANVSGPADSAFNFGPSGN